MVASMAQTGVLAHGTLVTFVSVEEKSPHDCSRPRLQELGSSASESPWHELVVGMKIKITKD